MERSAIGIFDSGIGGLTVAELTRQFNEATAEKEEVIAAANEYKMAMAFSGLRLFHH